MALGKPIVTTDMLECKKYHSIMIAQEHKEFLLLVERAFKLKDDENYLRLSDDEAKRNTWEARASELEKAIMKAVSLKKVKTAVNVLGNQK
jgi:teichuronic acid biosynthesis glycosyltransferase TuaH